MQGNDLPTYPKTRKLKITDYHHVAPLLKEYPLKISDYSFTNIFAWRQAYNYRISDFNEMLIVSGQYRKRPFILPPIGNPKMAADTVLQIFKMQKKSSKRPFLAVSPDHLAEELEEEAHIKIISDRENWDYIYNSSDLAKLEGQKYHSKRNLIKQFNSLYSAEVEELTTASCAEAIEYSDRWCEQRDCESNEGLKREHCAIYQMLSHFEALRLHGVLIRIGGEIFGISMGEKLNNDTYVIHVEKADKHHKGIYQFLNQKLAETVSRKYKWINREQDLGIKGLRRAKQSYYPDHFVKKYRILYLNSK